MFSIHRKWSGCIQIGIGCAMDFIVVDEVWKKVFKHMICMQQQSYLKRRHT